MTYGQLLDRASDALHAAAEAAADSSVDGHPSMAATVAARTRTYQQVIRLVDHFGAPVPDSVSVPIAEQLVNSTRRLRDTSPSRLLGVGLRAAHVDLLTLTPAAATSDIGPVAPHLAAAADHLGTAADLLAGHLGHRRGRPRTPEGQAIAAGAGQHDAIAELARITTDLIDVDRRLLGWFARGRAAPALRPVYEPVADRLRWWTRGTYPRLLRRIADTASGQSVLRLLETAPATERSTGPRMVASLRDVLHTIDTTRAWLQQRRQANQLAHTWAVARLAVTIVHGATGDMHGQPGRAAAAYHWEQITKRLQNLGDLDAGDRDHLVEELVAANDWLRRQLRAAHQVARLPGTAADRGWREGLSKLQGRLPGLAEQINRVVATAIAQGRLGVPEAALDMSAPRRGVFTAKVRWRQARPTDGQIEALRRELEVAAQVPADRELALRQALGGPAALAHLSFPQPPQSAHPVGQSAQPVTGLATSNAAVRRRRGRARR